MSSWLQENRLALAEALYQGKQVQAMHLFSVHMGQCMGANAVCIFCIVYDACPIVYMFAWSADGQGQAAQSQR